MEDSIPNSPSYGVTPLESASSIGRWTFRDLIDIAQLQDLTNDLYFATGIPSAIIDMDGKVLTGSGWQRICTDFHRVHPKTCSQCVESDIRLRETVAAGAPFVIYTCPRGLVDASAPIVIEGKRVANVFSGQVFTTPPDHDVEERFRRQAAEFGFDEAAYLAAFREIPFIPEDKFRSGVAFLAKFARVIAQIGLTRLHELEANAANLETKAHYEKIISSIPVGVYNLRVFPDGRESYQYISPQTERILGIPSAHSSAQARLISDRTHPDDLASLNESGIEARWSLSPFSWEGRILKGNGVSWVRVESHGEEHPDGGSNWHGVIADITERKSAEQALQKSEERIRSIFRAAPIGIGIVRDRILQEVNQRVSEMTGYSAEELAGQSARMLYPDDAEYEMVGRLKYDQIRRFGTGAVETRWRRKDGRIIDVLLSSTPLNPADFSEGVTFTALDITERKKTEERQKILVEMLDSAPSSIVVQNLAGEVLYANEKTFEIHGYTREEFLALSLSKLHTPGSAALIPERTQLIRKEGHASFEVEHYHKDGSILPMEVYVRTVQWDDVTAMLSVATLIADRKKSEEALRRSEEKHRALFEKSSIAIAVRSLGGEYLDFNDAYAEMLGFDRDELQSLPNAAITHPDDALKSRENLEAIIRGRADFLRYEKRYIRKDGSVVWGDVSVRPLRNNDGESVAVIGAVVDITERKQAEEALRRSELETKTILMSALDGFLVITKEGLIVEANDAYCQMSGYALGELIGRHITDVNANETPEEARRQIESVIERGADRFVTRHRRKGGSIYSVEISTHYLPIKGGRFFSFVRDITEEIRIREALTKSEESYRHIIERMVDVYYRTNRDGILTMVSPSAAPLLGYESVDDMIGLPVTSFYSNPSERSRFLAELQERGSVTDYRVLLRAKDGRPVPISTSSRFIYDDQGNLAGTEGVIRDLSERVAAEEERSRLQEQLTQAQKMESIGRLAGGVAHDFNNMLMSILGNTELLLEGMPSDHPHYGSLAEILQAGQRSAEITRQLLGFARKQTIAPKKIDLNDHISISQKMLRRLIGEAIELQFQSSAGLWPIMMDPSQVDQILMNLAVNSRDAIDGHGMILIRADNLSLMAPLPAYEQNIPPGNYVVLQFTDTGKGIPPEIIQLIFEPFFTTKAPGQGTGLGLSTIFGIVKQNNGYITLESSVGEGTTFRFYFPRLVVASEEANGMELTKNLPRGTETILLVEDEPAILKIGAAILSRLGYQVVTSSDPHHAIELFRQRSAEISLLISDMVMPKMNGATLVRKLTEIKPSLGILFISGYSSESAGLSQAIQEGATFLQKPFTARALAESVRKAIKPD